MHSLRRHSILLVFLMLFTTATASAQHWYEDLCPESLELDVGLFPVLGRFRDGDFDRIPDVSAAAGVEVVAEACLFAGWSLEAQAVLLHAKGRHNWGYQDVDQLSSRVNVGYRFCFLDNLISLRPFVGGVTYCNRYDHNDQKQGRGRHREHYHSYQYGASVDVSPINCAWIYGKAFFSPELKWELGVRYDVDASISVIAGAYIDRTTDLLTVSAAKAGLLITF